MAGATHLHNRLDAADVKHIFTLAEAPNVSNSEICRRYRISGASLSRILCIQGWSKKQIAYWGVPSIVKEEGRKRLKGIGEGAAKAEANILGEPLTKILGEPLTKQTRRTYLPFAGNLRKPHDTTEVANALANLISAQALVVEAFAECQEAGISIKVLEAVLATATPPREPLTKAGTG